MSRRWPKVGTLFAIEVPSGGRAFGRVLDEPLMAFYDYYDQERSSSPDHVMRQPIAFKIWVRMQAVNKGRWKKVGHHPLESFLQEKPLFCKVDPLSGALSLTVDGSQEIPTSVEQCEKLESAAVWEPHHVEERLEDHFAGRQNKWVLAMKRKRARLT